MQQTTLNAKVAMTFTTSFSHSWFKNKVVSIVALSQQKPELWWRLTSKKPKTLKRHWRTSAPFFNSSDLLRLLCHSSDVNHWFIQALRYPRLFPYLSETLRFTIWGFKCTHGKSLSVKCPAFKVWFGSLQDYKPHFVAFTDRHTVLWFGPS